MLRTPRLIPMLVLATCAWTQLSAQDPSSCTFYKVQIQAHYTSVYGVNNNGAIVGTYNPTSGSQAAYILKNGTVTAIFYPGAAMTDGFGINDYGAIVGAYVPPGIGTPDYGYEWKNGTFVNITFPGALSTEAFGINIHGVVVGSYQDSSGVFHGFRYSGGKYTRLDYPHAQSTVVSSINNNGVISGAYTDSSNVEHGFTAQNGTFTTIDYPGAANTSVGQVNNNGIVSGTYYDSAFTTWTGFLLENGRFKKISDPAASTETAVNGINDSNILVGNADYSGAGFRADGCVP
jgi:hypothetical protein